MRGPGDDGGGGCGAYLPSFLGDSSKALTRGWGDGSGFGVDTHSVLPRFLGESAKVLKKG